MNIPLLIRLRDADGRFVPLNELNKDVAQAQSELEQLTAFGFSIDIHPYLGAAYRGPAERLCPDQIEHALDTRRIGRRIAVWSRVASTNDIAARASASVANDGLVVLAEEQTAGRGRRGRSWSAPPRSALLMSVLVFPPPHLAEATWLTALGAVATAEIVAEWAGQAARIKWPNDVRIDGRKVAGILVERGAGAVIGIGLNANICPNAFPSELREKAASLLGFLNAPVDRSELARAVIRRLDYWYERGREEGAGPLSVRWRDLSEHRGTSVLVRTPQGDLAGRLDDLDLVAGLTLSVPDRPHVRVPAHEVLELLPIGRQENP